MSRFQGTVSRVIKFAGVGLHSGRMVNLEILPAAPNTGIYFQRSDIEGVPAILAHPANVSSTVLCTTLGIGPYQISTIEHLMAAFFGVGIDNALVRVDAGELPILDGSSAPFVDRLCEVGVQLQYVKRTVFDLEVPVEVVNGDRFIRYTPWDEDQAQFAQKLEIECAIEFPDSKAIGRQTIKFDFARDFMKIYEARTFCHLDDLQKMRANGLAKGGSLDNAVVVNKDEVINVEGLRYRDEFVRHKLLDFLGDLALLGGHLRGRVSMQKAGHALHVDFARRVLEHLDRHTPILSIEGEAFARAVNQD